MHWTFRFSILALCLSFYTATTLAGETRDCQAFYRITQTDCLQPKSIQFAKFSVRGYCGNSFVANRCRERARDRAHRCMKEHWENARLEISGDDSWLTSPPTVCRSEHFDSSTPLGYPIKTLLPALRSQVCRRFSCGVGDGPATHQAIKIEAVTDGGKHCPHAIVLDRNYSVDCRERTASPPPPAVVHAPPLRRIGWSENATQYRGRNGRVVNLRCSPNRDATAGQVWGSGIYTDDSSICSAAVHAGRIAPHVGGQVSIKVQPGRTSYVGKERNGVASQDYGRWQGSFKFVGR